ncbi:hypothetical protein PRUPE_3G015700 [Prunus persica]|uniref:Uncharacterized protein n=1 Tax=Prunus persica TaxID=3760 RepID=A0A251PWT3_PRUPE|nr:hypothetical protein PRUPE_3G015700 [Prunus persica]
MIETEQTERLISLYYTETPSQIQRMLIYFCLRRSTENNIFCRSQSFCK